MAYELKSEFKLKKTSVVVDIGSNDGVFLEPLINLGIKLSSRACEECC